MLPFFIARGGCEQRRPPVGMTGPRREIIALHRITKFRRVWIGLIACELAYMVQFVASS